MTNFAAIVYGPEEDCDALLAAFAAARRAEGAAVAGLVQINGQDATCDALQMELEDLATGRRIDICQDLGTGSANACRLDPQALAEAAGALRAALERPYDLVVVNKFGRMEAEGGGLLAEIGEAVASGAPVVVGVPRRLRDAFEAFSGGSHVALGCTPDALEAWWGETRGSALAAE